MTNEQILEIAYNHLHYYEGENGICEWVGDKKYLLEFALLIYEDGYNKGYDDSKSSSFKGFHTCLDD